MRFLLKSAFWLTAAFVMIRPGVDLSAAAGSATADVLAAGKTAISEQIARTECTTIECVGGKALLSAAVTSVALPAVSPMHELTTANEPAPVPRPRPAWLG